MLQKVVQVDYKKRAALWK